MNSSAPRDAIVGDAAPRRPDEISRSTTSMLRRSALRGRPARLLVALHGEREPQQALLFADNLARALGADLHVLRVVAPLEGATAIKDELAAALRDAHRVIAASRRTRALCDSVLSRPLPSLHLCVRVGGFVQEVAQRAAELDAMLIGLPSTKRPLAATVIRVAREADRPVVVTRGRPEFETLLAATDLEDRHVPLLRTAARLGQELDAAVVAVHGVLGSNAGLVSLQGIQCELEKVTRSFDAPVERVVVRSTEPAGCILEQARVRSAGLIIVGVRPHLARSHPSTAAKLLRRARGPVLVTPLGPAPHKG
jgi:nucleotide-binding universal stress UspA family protein